ncbi:MULTISPECIES: HAMP domain-containing sensor histidine kinase [Methylomonas]|uniref:HAMP domain-containing sensor histidine kinase n=1 Tax=Methylomonas TaxID=416 RepID=UPI001232EB4E|nr:HAMP domain-containing sensor histidine kinase [Methylomonas rhizoryzae]
MRQLFSLKAFISLGFGLAILPILFTVWLAKDHMQQALTVSKDLNNKVFKQTQSVLTTQQRAADTERKARLFILLSDPSVRQPYERQSYEAARSALKQSIDELLQLRVDNKIALLAEELTSKEELIYRQIINLDTPNALILPLDILFQGFRETSSALAREFESYVEREFSQLAEQADSLQSRFVSQSLILLSLSAACMLALLAMMLTPLRQLDSAINRLASGLLKTPITIDGPPDLKALGQQLEWLRNYLFELQRSKQLLMSNFAYEIEGSLDDLRTGLDLLSPGLDKAQQEILQPLLTHVERIEHIRAAFLRFGDISTASPSQAKEPVDLPHLLDTVLSYLQPEIITKALSVKLQLQPAQILGFSAQLRAVLAQLLSNAIQHSPQHSEIAVSLTISGQDIELTIADEGPGIPEEERASIFEPFRSTTNHDNSGINRLGLGLCLAKQFILNHQGTIEFIDPKPPKHGACVYVKLPLTIF